MKENYFDTRQIFLDPPIPESSQFLPDMTRKTALIMGGSRGIGQEVARLAKQQGARIMTVSRHNEPTQWSDRHFQADLTNTNSIDTVWYHALNDGMVDFVFNNIGLYEQGNLADTSKERWDQVINDNLSSMFWLTKRAAQHLASSGVMVNMASRPTLDSYAGWATYTLAKQGVITLTQAAAEEAGRDIKAYSICPSRVDTKFREDLFPNEPKEQRLTPEDTAMAIMFLANRSLPNGGYHWIKQLYG